ncbi:MAG TPA: glycosyltransferase [Candidatus Polarisedimenticolia bacterium]|nr:glycosyltransferase [Candidatus Polarisedimenticolia bacterium]
MKPLRVLHVNTEKGWRGGEVQTLLLARGLSERGHVSLLAAPAGSRLEALGREAGLETVPLVARGELDPAGAWRLARDWKRFRPDLLHYHTSHAITLGTIASYLAGRRPAVASRRVSFPLSRNPVARFKYTHRVDRVLAVSGGIRDLLVRAGIPASCLRVVHSAIDLDRFRTLRSRGEIRSELGFSSTDFVIGTVGHLASHKGHRVLIEAAARAASRARCRYLVAGTGECEAALKEAVRRLNLQDSFRFVGFLERVEEILPGLDLFVFPSLSGEGSPAALKEAMACSVPVVASRISGVEEVSRDGVEALLVPPGDPAALAAAVDMLASDRELCLEFGRRGRQRAREFGVDRMVLATESAYREVLGSTGL